MAIWAVDSHTICQLRETHLLSVMYQIVFRVRIRAMTIISLPKEFIKKRFPLHAICQLTCMILRSKLHSWYKFEEMYRESDCTITLTEQWKGKKRPKICDHLLTWQYGMFCWYNIMIEFLKYLGNQQYLSITPPLVMTIIVSTKLFMQRLWFKRNVLLQCGRWWWWCMRARGGYKTDKCLSCPYQ